MDLKDYLHLYFGCPAIVNYGDGDFKSKIEWTEIAYPQRVKKLILRPLSDMTEEEKNEWKSKLHTMNFLGAAYSISLENPESFRWLLSQGFDLFNLINTGLAIDAKEVENAK